MDLDAWRLQYNALYGHHIERGEYADALLGISTPGNWAGFKIPLLDTDAIDRKLTQLDRQGKDIYFRVVPLQPGTYGPGERAGADRNLAMPAAWGDGDTADGVHKPFRGEFAGYRHPSTQEVLDMYWDIELPPNLAIGSGGGVHPYLVFDNPIENALPGTPSLDLLLRLDHFIKEAAKARGFGMDTGITSDPARILRVAGSRNFKRGKDDPKPVTILAEGVGINYTFEELDEKLPPIPKIEKRTRVASVSTPGERKKGNAWAAVVPVSFLMEGVWGMETNDGDIDSGGERRWVYPREDGTASLKDKHAKTFLGEKSGAEFAVAYGGRIQDEWGVGDYRTALTSWDLLVTIVGGDGDLARYIAQQYPEPSEDLLDLLRAANERRYELAAEAS